MSQDNYEVQSSSENLRNSEKSSTFEFPKIDYGFRGVMPVTATSVPAIPVSNELLTAIPYEYTAIVTVERISEQNQAVKDALSDEIEN